MMVCSVSLKLATWPSSSIPRVMYLVPVLCLDLLVMRMNDRPFPLIDVLVMRSMPYITGRIYGSIAGWAPPEVLPDALPDRKSIIEVLMNLFQ